MRATKSVKIEVRYDEAGAEELDKRATAAGLDRSSYIRLRTIGRAGKEETKDESTQRTEAD